MCSPCSHANNSHRGLIQSAVLQKIIPAIPDKHCSVLSSYILMPLAIYAHSCQAPWTAQNGVRMSSLALLLCPGLVLVICFRVITFGVLPELRQRLAVTFASLIFGLCPALRLRLFCGALLPICCVPFTLRGGRQ